jgi:MscS family membrane protein
MKLIGLLNIEFINKNPLIEVGADIALLLVITLVLTLLVKVLFNRIAKIFESTSSFWDEALLEAFRKPLLFIIWMVGVILCLEEVNRILKLQDLKFLSAAKNIVIVVAIAWFLFGLIKQLEKFWLEKFKKKKTKLDPTTVSALTKVLNIVVIVLTGLALMQSFGFSVGAILAFIGGGGVAAGFAAKDFLANFFGAVMIYMDRPFKVGDWIRSPDKEIEGYVENISLRATMVRTLDKRPLYVPNSVFNTISIENPSRMSHRRILETIGLRHEDFSVVERISKDAEKMLRSHKEIDVSLPIVISLNDVSSTSLNMVLIAFTKAIETENFYKIKQEIMLKLFDIIHKHEAKIAQLPSTVVTE